MSSSLNIKSSPAKPPTQKKSFSEQRDIRLEPLILDEKQIAEASSTISYVHDNFAEKRKSPMLTSSPITYTISQLYKHQPKKAVESPTESVAIICRVFYPDNDGVQFCVEHGRLANALTILHLVSDHLKIDRVEARKCFSLWFISPLLEVPLKDHHVPFEVAKNWAHFVQKFTTAPLELSEKDEPLLMIKRNVQLSVEQELEFQENENVTEMLYRDAKTAYMNGRYLCNQEISIQVAALQMCIEWGPYDPDVHTIDLVKSEIDEFVPFHLMNSMRRFQVFGFPIIECHSLENDILDEYKSLSMSEQYIDQHQRRNAYLNIFRDQPLYGSAYFCGQIERRLANSPKNVFKKVFLSSDIDILVAINRNFLVIIDAEKCEILLAKSIFDCTWNRLDIDSKAVAETPSKPSKALLPSLLLVFPEDEESTSTDLKTMLLQVFSRQAVMMDALLRSLISLSELEAAELEIIHDTLLDEVDTPDHPQVTPVAAHSTSIDEQGDVVGELPSANYRKLNFSLSRQSASLKESPLAQKMDKMCLATYNSKGECINAQGSFAKIAPFYLLK